MNDKNVNVNEYDVLEMSAQVCSYVVVEALQDLCKLGAKMLQCADWLTFNWLK